MPLFVEATAAYATLGEITGVLRRAWGDTGRRLWCSV